MLLKDKVAVITGGAGPNCLRFATAKLMAQHGARQHGGSIVCISSVSAQRGGGILGGPH